MSKEQITATYVDSATGDTVSLATQRYDRPALVRKIGKTAYQVRVYFSTTSPETMSDKIKRLLRNEVSHL